MLSLFSTAGVYYFACVYWRWSFFNSSASFSSSRTWSASIKVTQDEVPFSHSCSTSIRQSSDLWGCLAAIVSRELTLILSITPKHFQLLAAFVLCKIFVKSVKEWPEVEEQSTVTWFASNKKLTKYLLSRLAVRCPHIVIQSSLKFLLQYEVGTSDPLQKIYLLIQLTQECYADWSLLASQPSLHTAFPTY